MILSIPVVLVEFLLEYLNFFKYNIFRKFLLFSESHIFNKAGQYKPVFVWKEEIAMANQILLEVNDHIAIVTVNREEYLNAFNYKTLLDLQDKVKEIRINPDVRAVVFIGSGEKAFSVGADLKERKTLTDEQVKRNLYKINEVFNSIDHLPQPTIALLMALPWRRNGVSSCLRFPNCGRGSGNGVNGNRSYHIPGAGGTKPLPRLIRQAKALELILTARRFYC